MACLACSCAWRVCVLTCFACLACLHAWHAYMLGMLACLSASLLGALAWVREMFYLMKNYSMMKCFIFLCVCILDVLFCLICFTFQYLNLKILTAKNLCALLSWTYFLFTFWYQLIKLFETNLREAGKSIDIWYSCSCSKAISIFYSLYIHLLH